MRDLTDSVSTRKAAEVAGLAASGPVEVAELTATYTHEEIILAAALGLPADCAVNPSGGALAATPEPLANGLGGMVTPLAIK